MQTHADATAGVLAAGYSGRLAAGLILSAGLMAAAAIPAPAQTVSQADASHAHIAIANPAELSKGDAQKIYDELKTQMAKRYAGADIASLASYQDWTAYNSAPYLSSTHGQRYVNNYANDAAHDYAGLGDGQTLPVGAVLAKDSFTVTKEGHIFPAALFAMEKLPAGQSPQTGDWRYIMVMPDGSVFGDTQGIRSEKVAYCHDCHEAAADRDFTFFVPEDYRANN